MAEPATATCKICLGNIKQEVKFNDLALNSTLEFPTENVLSIIENRIACDNCKVDIEKTHQLYMQSEHIVIKEEMKEEDIVKAEGIVADQYVLFNTDIPLFIEESVPINILYCYQCNYGTNDKQNLTDHIFAHRYKCDCCNYTTYDNSVLKTHQQIHTQPLQVSEDLLNCGYRTNCKNILKIHMRTCLNGQKSSLKKQQNLFKRHKIIYSEDKFKSSYTDKYPRNLKERVKIHSGERNFSCDQCNYNTYSNRDLKRHKIVHSEEKPYSCSVCDYTSKRIGDLKKHMEIHFGERNFSCNKCDYKTHSNWRLTRHKIVHSEQKPYKCDLCDHTSKYARNIKNHMKIHSGERNFSCDQCDFKAVTNASLTSHKRVHSEEKPYKCSLCDYTCKYAGHLKIHMMIHSGELNFSCDQCNYKTYSNSKLKIHKPVHSEEKPYNCNLCNYTGKCEGYLKRHMKIHSGAGTNSSAKPTSMTN